jgi:hypothetical protein
LDIVLRKTETWAMILSDAELAGRVGASERLACPGKGEKAGLRRFAQWNETGADFFAWNRRNPLKTPVSDE